MVRALGVNDANMIVFGLAISNGLSRYRERCWRNTRGSLMLAWESAWLFGDWPASSSAKLWWARTSWG